MLKLPASHYRDFTGPYEGYCLEKHEDFDHTEIRFDTSLSYRIPMSNGSIQGVPGGKINILGGHSIGHSKQKCLYEHVSYSERFPRQNYLDFLQNELPKQLEDVPSATRIAMYFQHDGAPSHHTRHVMQHLNDTFPNRWIGRGSTINWPPRSPDLTPLDFCLWGMMKSEVYRKKSGYTR